MKRTTSVVCSIAFQQQFTDSYLRNNRAAGVKAVTQFPTMYEGSLLAQLTLDIFENEGADGIDISNLVAVGEFQPISDEYDPLPDLVELGAINGTLKNNDGADMQYYMAASKTLVHSSTSKEYNPDQKKIQRKRHFVLDLEFMAKLWNYKWQGNRHKTLHRHTFVISVFASLASLQATKNSTPSTLNSLQRLTQSHGPIFGMACQRRGFNKTSRHEEEEPHQLPFPGQVFDKLSLPECIVAQQAQKIVQPVAKRSVAVKPVVRRAKLAVQKESNFRADSATEYASGRPKRKASVMTCSYTHDPLEALIVEENGHRRRSRVTTIGKDGKDDDTDPKDKMEDENDSEDSDDDEDDSDRSDEQSLKTEVQTSCQSETTSPVTRHGRTFSMHTVNTATTFESEFSATDDACASDNELYQCAMLQRPERSDHSLFTDPSAEMCNLNHSFSQYCDSFEKDFDNWDAHPRLSTLRGGGGGEELASDDILSACEALFSDDSDDILSVLQDLVCMDTAV